MTPFWRTTPLTPDESKLLQLTLEAHAASAFRGNASSGALCGVAGLHGTYTQALTAALSTLGGTHAPIAETYALLTAGDTEAEARLLRKERLPGWGNSFHKGEPDPLWVEVANQLRLVNAALADRLDVITELLVAVGKKVLPNPSAYTAAVAITLGIPAHLAPWLFVQGRLLSWSQLFNHVVKGEE
jgi:citrate synthase